MSLNFPEFASEQEEADWWYEHREEVSDDFAEAAAKGELRSLRGVLLQDHDIRLPDAVVTGPFSADELSKVKKIAAAEGLDAEQVIVRVVHEAVQSKLQAA